MKKSRLFTLLLAGSALVTLVACSSSTSSKSSSGSRTYTIGVASGVEKAEWTQVAKDVKSKGITLNIKEFTDYAGLNPALTDGSLDLNAFQHQAFLDNWNKQNKGSLVSIGITYISPLGLYSQKIKTTDAIKDGDKIAIPNDPANETRGLELLQAINVIKLKSTADPTNTTLKDIETYNKKVTIKEIQGDQIASALPDLTAAVINTNFVQDQLHETPSAAIYRDTDQGSKVSNVYKNLVAVTKVNKDKEDFKTLVKAYQTDAVASIIKQKGDSPAW